MAASKVDPEILAHLEWLGFVRPTGLVVSGPALVRAGAILDRRDIAGQQLLRDCLGDPAADPTTDAKPYLASFRQFAESVLDWSFSPKGYAGTPDSPIPAELEVHLPEYRDTLRPDFAVRELNPKEGGVPWQLLVQVLDTGVDFDSVAHGHGQLEASAHGRMERLLRQTGVAAGLLFNGVALRLISAPRGESSGWLDFRVADMVQAAGRPISTALRLLLDEPRLLTLPREKRLAALLEDSRKFQNEVSERLSEQVLHALYALVRGFQAANDAARGELLRQPLTEHPDDVYRALLTVILRLVFVLYAEERDLLPGEETFLRYYSLAGLYERLREDAALFPDTIDERYGAWAQVMVLFRMVYDGASAGPMQLPKRHGVLFDPDRFPFLEGRTSPDALAAGQRFEPPLVPDGTVYRALENLLVLDAERISYRALDVEQIGSVYETMMGFRIQAATGRSIAIRAQKPHGAPTVVDLDRLLAEAAGKREKWIQEQTDRKLSEGVKKAVAAASTVADLHAALLPVSDTAATPDLVPHGAMILQPSEERRRSGSHYTPRVLTEPIVRTTLEPVLKRLRASDGRPPRPAEILDLKVCDPAMGSGAFLVEACRQLGDALLESWHAYGETPEIPADEDEVIFARRLIAQRCLYGVDRNPVAVDLAKVSLWLVTLAREHALTFVDHALRHGDSLAGLTRKQIEAFHWDADARRNQDAFEMMQVREHVDKVIKLRALIRNADESVADQELRSLWNDAQAELDKVRLFGDLVLAAYFSNEKPIGREAKRSEYANAVVSGNTAPYRRRLAEWRQGTQPLVPFHWEIEFPEVFERDNAGFDAIVGNPPFLGGRRISTIHGLSYLSMLRQAYPGSGNLCDLVAYFFRRAFQFTRVGGSMGLIATNTISQGDTREGGLSVICESGGYIYFAQSRLKWPGSSAVIVSQVCVRRGERVWPCILDGRQVDKITSFLFHSGPNRDPVSLRRNESIFSKGSQIYGQGFLFDDDDPKASPTSVMDDLLASHPECAERILPYIGERELNDSPSQDPHRYVIYLSDLTNEADLRPWDALARIVREKVKPERDHLGNNPVNTPLKRRWWAYQAHRPEFYRRIDGMHRVLALSQVSTHLALAFLGTGMVYSQKLVVFALDTLSSFGALQARVHEVWARFFSSTLGDALNYSPSDCFETFPFPRDWHSNSELEESGKAYYEFRADLMVRNNEGLTRTYNRFHDPEEGHSGIVELRELHRAMDRAVLKAYDWADIPTECDFLLDYEIDEEEWGTKKRPYRYRWPDEVRDEVLARLLELNKQRAEEEARSEATAERTRVAKGTALAVHTQDLFA